jgi:uncharacterized protein YjiS (DUF1127 family)
MNTITNHESFIHFQYGYDRVSRGIRAFVSMIARELRRRRAIAHVSGLNDHLLRDIGLSRNEVFDAVHGRGAFRRAGVAGPHRSDFQKINSPRRGREQRQWKS